jgi:hypothetical protein
MEHWGAYESSLEVVRPLAYAYHSGMTALTEKLRQHGVEVQEVAEMSERDVEVYRVDLLKRESRRYQNHNQIQVEVTAKSERREIGPDMMWVSTAQPLGNLVVYLLEPLADDGLTAWNVLDDVIRVDKDFPVVRVMR